MISPPALRTVVAVRVELDGDAGACMYVMVMRRIMRTIMMLATTSMRVSMETCTGMALITIMATITVTGIITMTRWHRMVATMMATTRPTSAAFIPVSRADTQALPSRRVWATLMVDSITAADSRAVVDSTPAADSAVVDSTAVGSVVADSTAVAAADTANWPTCSGLAAVGKDFSLLHRYEAAGLI